MIVDPGREERMRSRLPVFPPAWLSVFCEELRCPAESWMAVVELVRRRMTRTSSLRSTNCLVTWEPRNPLAPITNFFAPAMG
jgi:hypothetical protein